VIKGRGENEEQVKEYWDQMTDAGYRFRFR
jgi:hypothetical protein